MSWLKKELGLLANNIKADHEEQVAEIISRYPPEKLNKFVDDAVTVENARRYAQMATGDKALITPHA